MELVPWEIIKFVLAVKKIGDYALSGGELDLSLT